MDPYKSQIKKLIRQGSLKVIKKISIEEESRDEIKFYGGCLVRKHWHHRVTSRVDSNNNKADYLEFDQLQD